MTPAVVTRGGQPLLALGASGGRRITNCVSQLISHVVDHDMGAQEAVESPRVDASTPWVTVDVRLSKAVIEDLMAWGWDVRLPPAPEQSAFASPVVILASADGSLRGGDRCSYAGSCTGSRKCWPSDVLGWRLRGLCSMMCVTIAATYIASTE